MGSKLNNANYASILIVSSFAVKRIDIATTAVYEAYPRSRIVTPMRIHK